MILKIVLPLENPESKGLPDQSSNLNPLSYLNQQKGIPPNYTPQRRDSTHKLPSETTFSKMGNGPR
jgi:hypothetical protein